MISQDILVAYCMVPEFASCIRYQSRQRMHRLGIVYEGLPDSDILALTLTLCYRVDPTETCENPISVDALVSCVGKKTHSDVQLITVAVLVCTDEYYKKSAEEKEEMRMEGNENQATRFIRDTQRGPLSEVYVFTGRYMVRVDIMWHIATCCTDKRIVPR